MPARIAKLLLLLFLGFSVFKLFGAWHNRLWLGETRITIIVASENPTLYSYNPENATIAEIKIPQNTEVESVSGYGNWLVGSLWNLGKQEKKSGFLLSRSVQKSLGVPVDAWIGPGGEVLFTDHKLGFLAAVFQVARARSIESNLTFFDRVNIILAASRVGRLSRISTDLVKRGVISKTVLPDGMSGYVITPEKTTSGLDLRDDKVFMEAKTLKVTNSTKTSGLAAQVSRVASVLGLRVISTDTTTQKVLGVCVVAGKESDLKSVAAQRLVQIYGCSQEVGNPSGPTNLEIIIGAKFANEY